MKTFRDLEVLKIVVKLVDGSNKIEGKNKRTLVKIAYGNN